MANNIKQLVFQASCPEYSGLQSSGAKVFTTRKLK
jgi:hypothetical protein